MSDIIYIHRSRTVAPAWIPFVKEAIIKRLREVADGEFTPGNTHMDGVCAVIEGAVEPLLRPMAQSILYGLAYSIGASSNPLGDYMHNGNLWHGIRGARRRTYAGLLAALLEDSRILYVTSFRAEESPRIPGEFDAELSAYFAEFPHGYS